MAEIIDLCEYRKSKERDESEKLRAELADLIAEIGGVHCVPMYIMENVGMPPVDTTLELNPTFYSQPWTSWTWTVEDADDSKE